MKRYSAEAQVTITITKEFSASSLVEAQKIARGLIMPTVCMSCEDEDGFPETWEVDEIDGMAQHITVRETP